MAQGHDAEMVPPPASWPIYINMTGVGGEGGGGGGGAVTGLKNQFTICVVSFHRKYGKNIPNIIYSISPERVLSMQHI